MNLATQTVLLFLASSALLALSSFSSIFTAAGNSASQPAHGFGQRGQRQACYGGWLTVVQQMAKPFMMRAPFYP